jgi:hypothetical protein
MERDDDFPTKVPEAGRILEIGETGLFHWAMKERTDALYTSYRADLRRDRAYLGLRSLLKAFRDVRRGRYGLVVLHPPLYPGWHWRSFLAAVKFSVLKGRPRDLYGAVTSPLYFSLLRLLPACRMIAIERSDGFGLPAHSFFLLDRAEAFYKRELPYDHWQVFFGSAHRRLPGRRFRLERRWSKRLAKLRPIGLGLPIYAENHANAAYPAEKTSDLFFAATIAGNSSVRAGVPALLDKLRAAGFAVDAPDRHLPADEFMKRCAQAWITLSPAGLGWDCYRHMEAAVAGSVPLVSAPTIDRYRPLVIGEQCLSYHPDEDRIVAIVGAALADKERLRAMALSARQHVLKHLTVRAISVDLLARHCGETGAEASTGG